MTDLSTLFGPPPAGPAQNVMYRQGTIKTFNALTLENTVDVGGTVLTNLPVLGVGEATLLVPGSVVGILVVGDDDGGKGMTILGRSVVPNTPAATDAITLLGQSVATDFIVATENTNSCPFVDLATPGPIVSLNIRASGKALVFIAATINVNIPAGPPVSYGAFMNFITSGANTLAVQPGGLGFNVTTPAAFDGTWSIARMIPLTGLNAGPTTFRAQYANGLACNPANFASFRNRSMAVFAL